MGVDTLLGIGMIVACLVLPKIIYKYTSIHHKIMNDKTGRYKFIGRNQSGYETYLDTKTGETYNRYHDM